MKSIILVILFVTNFYSCSKSQDQITEKNVDWASAQYFYDSGPLPPQYHYEYFVNINKEGICNFACNLGYDKSLPAIIYNFNLSKDTIDILDKAIKESKVLTTDIESLPPDMHPIGGATKKIRIILLSEPGENLYDRPPRVKETPEFPVDKFKNILDKLYGSVNSIVPKYIWDDLQQKRDDFEASYKK
jgi:hypothetical protein